MQEIQKDREDEFVNKDLIKDAIWQFIYMGFEKKATIKKMEGGEFTWLGEKNFHVITKYNKSINYAMAVYQLSKKIKDSS